VKKQTQISGRHRQCNFLSCYSRMQNIAVPSATKTNYYLLLFVYEYNTSWDYSCLLTLPYSVSSASLLGNMDQHIRLKFNYFHFLSPAYGKIPKHKDSQKIFRINYKSFGGTVTSRNCDHEDGKIVLNYENVHYLPES
jgi:hypothetical protein